MGRCLDTGRAKFFDTRGDAELYAFANVEGACAYVSTKSVNIPFNYGMNLPWDYDNNVPMDAKKVESLLA